MLNKLFNDESGVIISAELALVLSIAVLSMVVGLSEIAVALNKELNDISNAIGALDQSYAVTGFKGADAGNTPASTKVKSYAGGVQGAGSKWTDQHDLCDRNNDCCDLVGGAPTGGDSCG